MVLRQSSPVCESFQQITAEVEAEENTFQIESDSSEVTPPQEIKSAPISASDFEVARPSRTSSPRISSSPKSNTDLPTDLKLSGTRTSTEALASQEQHSPSKADKTVSVERQRRATFIKMGYSKDTTHIRDSNANKYSPLKSCILIPKDDGSGDRIQVKKAKSVHFADSLGKPLKSVKTMLKDDDDFEFDLSFLSLARQKSCRKTFPSVNTFHTPNILGDYKEEKGKLVNFKQPVASPTFMAAVKKHRVRLETVVFREYGVFVTVTVQNISFEKRVFAKYTLDHWETTNTVVANYVMGSSTGSTDTFSFEISIPNLDSDSNIQFAVAYEAAGECFWDNNDCKNYEVLFYRKKTTKDKAFIEPEKKGEDGFLLSSHSFIGWST